METQRVPHFRDGFNFEKMAHYINRVLYTKYATKEISSVYALCVVLCFAVLCCIGLHSNACHAEPVQAKYIRHIQNSVFSQPIHLPNIPQNLIPQFIIYSNEFSLYIFRTNSPSYNGAMRNFPESWTMLVALWIGYGKGWISLNGPNRMPFQFISKLAQISTISSQHTHSQTRIYLVWMVSVLLRTKEPFASKTVQI